MNPEIRFSDEFLNAYLDDELAHTDKENLLKALREDEQLSRRLCQLQRVKNMVQLAYHDISPRLENQSEPKRFSIGVSRYASAASVLLLVGALGGWIAHNHFSKQPGLTEIIHELRTNTPSNGTPWKIMVQVSTNDRQRHNILIDETERLLKTAQNNNERVIIQIVANSRGIDLLKDDNSIISSKMRQLSKQYNNLILAVCGQTLQKLNSNNQPVPRLLNETIVVQSALHESIQKQKQGWTYIKI